MTKETDKISVIVPVYNVKDYLEDCVRSVTDQTYPDLEILLIDDGSDDGSGEICDRLQMTDERIKVFHEKNKGVSSARNKGLKEATGAYIAFVDSDDILETDMYTYLMGLLKMYEAQIAACSGWYQYDAGAGKKFESPKKEVCLNGREALGVLHERTYLRAYIWNKLFRREALDGIRFSTELSFAEDYEMFCRVLEQCDRIVCGTKPKYHYMQRKSGACNQGYDRNYQKAMLMFEDCCNMYSRRYPQYRTLFENHYLFDLMGMAAAMGRNGNYVAADCKKIKKYIRTKLPQYLTDKKVPLYLKGSACVCCISVRAFSAVYRMLHRVEIA
ncbi:MAG TPA: glycosyltransferase [Roseburia sp.]|nr:glycosyltransferase [Roseburia sp.]